MSESGLKIQPTVAQMSLNAGSSRSIGEAQTMAGAPVDLDVAILVVSCDAYQDLWQPFFQCLFKYWPDCPFPIFLGANTLRFEHPRVSMINVGPDVDYSSNLLKMLEAIDQEWVILWIEDRFLARPVDTPRLFRCIQDVQQQGAYGKLVANYPYARTANTNAVLGEVARGEPYRVSITVGLWRKQTLQELLRPGESAWELERAGSVRSNEIPEKFFSVAARFRHDPPIIDEHIIIKGRITRPGKRFLDRERLDDFQSHRPTQTLGSALYVWVFVGLRLVLLRMGLDVTFKPIWRMVSYLKALRAPAR